MSTLISIRVEDDVLQKIDEQGKRGTVINAILANHFSKDPVWARPAIPKHEVIEAVKSKKDVGGFNSDGKLVLGRGTGQMYYRPHDKKTCRVYKCGMCADAD
jgi:hypothetical protein